MDRDLEDLVEACGAAGGSAGLLRALLRQAKESVDPASDPSLEDGDTLVLSGRPDTLAVAEQRLLRG